MRNKDKGDKTSYFSYTDRKVSKKIKPFPWLKCESYYALFGAELFPMAMGNGAVILSLRIVSNIILVLYLKENWSAQQ